jgi:hypothetical protein
MTALQKLLRPRGLRLDDLKSRFGSRFLEVFVPRNVAFLYPTPVAIMPMIANTNRSTAGIALPWQLSVGLNGAVSARE